MTTPLQLPADPVATSAATNGPLLLPADTPSPRDTAFQRYLAAQPAPPQPFGGMSGVRPGETPHPGPTLGQAAGSVADVVLNIGDIGAGTIRHVARIVTHDKIGALSQAAVGPLIAMGMGPLVLALPHGSYVPTTPDEKEDAAHARMGVALGASFAVANVAGPVIGLGGDAMASVLPAEAMTGTTGVVLRSLGMAVRSLGATYTGGAALGSIRPTQPDETRLHAIQNDALGFAAWDAGLQTLILGSKAASALLPNPSLTGAAAVFTPDGVGPITTSTQHMTEALQRSGLGPSHAADVLAGRATIQDAFMDQFGVNLRGARSIEQNAAVQQQMQQGVQAATAAATQHGFAWLADGRPIEKWPVNAGETFVVRSTANQMQTVRLANATNQVKAYGVGPTLEDALHSTQPIRSNVDVPDVNVTETGVAVGATPLSAPPGPEFQGVMGRMRWISENLLRNRFAQVQQFDGGLGATLNNHAAVQMASGYNALIWKRLTGIENLTDVQRTLLGRFNVDRELNRTRTLIQAHADEATQMLAHLEGNQPLEIPGFIQGAASETPGYWPVAASEGPRWRQQLAEAQTALGRVRPNYLAPEEYHAALTDPTLSRIQASIDRHLQPWLEDHKLMAGLSTGALEAAHGDPVLSLIARDPEAEAAIKAGAPISPRAPLTSAFQVGPTRFNLPRTGAAAEYETDIGNLVSEWTNEVMSKNAKRATFDYIANARWTRTLGTRTLANGKVITEAPPAGYETLPLQSFSIPGIDIGNTRLAVPKVVADAFNDFVTRSRSMQMPAMLKPYTDFMDTFTALQLTAPAEAQAHAWRVVSGLSRLPGMGGDTLFGRLAAMFPSLGPKGTAIMEMARVFSNPVEDINRLWRMARTGTLTGRPLSETANNFIMNSVNKVVDLDAFRRGVFDLPDFRPGLFGVETRVRMAAAKWIEMQAQDEGRVVTDNEFRDFVNGFGTYAPEQQPAMLSWLRKSRLVAFGSYSLGGSLTREMDNMLGPFLPNTSGGTGLPMSVWNDIPKAKQMAMRAAVAWRGMIGDLTMRAAITKMNSGYWPWQTAHRSTGHITDVAIGKQGEGDNERFLYATGAMLDPGMSRAYHTTFARALATAGAARRPQEFMQNATTDLLNTVSNLASPGIRFASIAATGTTTHFVEDAGSVKPMQVVPTQVTRGAQLPANIGTAVALGNPITQQLLEGQATRDIADPDVRRASQIANLLSSGVRLGPPRAVWQQLDRSRVTARYAKFVSDQASYILAAPDDATLSKRYDEIAGQITSQVPADDQESVLRDLQRTVRSRPRARARRAAASPVP